MTDKELFVTHISKNKNSIPPKASDALRLLGEQIALARKRRGITQEALAQRMFITRKTLSRLEHGDPGVSLSTLAAALWALNLEGDLLKIAAPEHDKVGLQRERQRTPTRVRNTSKTRNLDF